MLHKNRSFASDNDSDLHKKRYDEQVVANSYWPFWVFLKMLSAKKVFVQRTARVLNVATLKILH